MTQERDQDHATRAYFHTNPQNCPGIGAAPALTVAAATTGAPEAAAVSAAAAGAHAPLSQPETQGANTPAPAAGPRQALGEAAADHTSQPEDAPPNKRQDDNTAHTAHTAHAAESRETTKPGAQARRAQARVPALVPVTVPDLPKVVLERAGVLQAMVGALLGTSHEKGADAASPPSTRSGPKQVAIHGQGGVGKTTMATAVARNPQVRAAFDRVAWVSVGQTPMIMELQRVLFAQLTGTTMEATATATAALQLDQLREACAGQRWLLVLDDVWDSSHEKLLNCIDDCDGSGSALLISTRIRGLLQSSQEISLNLLTPGEAVDLLHRTAEIRVTDDDDAAWAALSKLAELCGFLPLFVRICGGMLGDYGGSSDWQTELVEALEEDRLGTMEEDADGITERVVGTSVSTLDDTATKLFDVLGLCTEDVPVPFAALQVLWASTRPADGSPATNKGKGRGKGAEKRVLRRSVATMTDRNLLHGNLVDGVYPHDIVRCYMRGRLGGEAAIRTMQRAFIKGVMERASQATSKETDVAYDQYMRKALVQHMTEALLPDALADDEASMWLDSSNDVMNNTVVRAAADAVGPTLLLVQAKQLENVGDAWRASKRYASASFTPALMSQGSGGGSADGISAPANAALVKGIELLERQGQGLEARTLEVQLRGKLGFRLSFSDPWALKSAVRAGELIQHGVDVTQPAVMMALGCTIIWLVVIEPLGVSVDGAGNWQVESKWRETQQLYRTALQLFSNSYALLPDGETSKLVAAGLSMFILSMQGNWDDNCDWHAAMLPHARLKWIIETYDYDLHHAEIVEKCNLDVVAWACPGQQKRAVTFFGWVFFLISLVYS